MKNDELVAYAKRHCEEKAFPCHRILGSKRISDPDWIEYFVDQIQLDCSPSELWEVRFELYPPNDTHAESHGIASFVLDPVTLRCGILR